MVPLPQMPEAMEVEDARQKGIDGTPRPRALRRAVGEDWPATLDPLSDTYVDQTFRGPLG